MGKWYINKIILNALILIMFVGFIAYIFKPIPPLEELGLIIFLTAGTLVMVRGVVKITMGMRKSGR